MNDNNELDDIVEDAIEKVKSKSHPHNRAERRALAKKLGKKGREQFNLLTDTVEKLNYIDLIQKLRALNEKKEIENNGNSNR